MLNVVFDFLHTFSHLILIAHCEVCTAIAILLTSTETDTGQLQPLCKTARLA